MSAQSGLDDARTLVRRALPAFGIDQDARLTFVKQRENVVFRVDDGEHAYAVRLHRHGHRSPAEIRCETVQARALQSAGVPVSEFLAPIDNRDAEVADDVGRTHFVDVQRWVEGSELFGDSGETWAGQGDADPVAFERVGEVLGRLHAASSRLGKLPGYERGAWDLDGLTGEAPLWGDPRRLARAPEDVAAIDAATRRIRNRLQALGTDGDVFGVIHADTTPENILVTGDPAAGGAITLIDFDDFGEGWWLFDLATLLFWYQRHERYAELRAALLRGYEREFEIPERATRELDTLILARGLTYLAWAADRPGDETSEFLAAEVLPVLVAQCRALVAAGDISEGEGDAATGTGAGGATADGEGRASDAELIERRSHTIGPYSPLFYDQPLHFVSGDGAWLTSADGTRYLDAYNNVPVVGHANPRVADAVSSALHTLNVHTRYLSRPIVDYAEALLDTFEPRLDRVYFTNSGTESNELALRIARHATGARGFLVTDFSYHGNSHTLAELTTGLTVSEPFGDHVRTLHVPDLDATDGSEPAAERLLARALAEVDAAIESLVAEGHGVAAQLIDPSFSTEGLPRLPEGYLVGLAERVRAAGGLVIADEVQSGVGRLGDEWWGHQATGFSPDLVTLGKPLGNGFPLGGVVTTEALLESFSSVNMYFNTFAGTPAAAAAGHSVLREMTERDLLRRTGDLGRHVRRRLTELAERHDRVAAAKGRGLFFGLELVDDDGAPDGALAKRVVEALVTRRILISRIGPHDNVLKIRPPLVIDESELDSIVDALSEALDRETSR